MTNKNLIVISIVIIVVTTVGVIFLTKNHKFISESRSIPSVLDKKREDKFISHNVREAVNISAESQNNQLATATTAKISAEQSEGAKEIRLNSADEPNRKEAMEIELDENDNPLVDEKGNPIGEMAN